MLDPIRNLGDLLQSHLEQALRPYDSQYKELFLENCTSRCRLECIVNCFPRRFLLERPV